ncbi:7TM receptor with intracellular metal dependent phosphohydrolase [Clostridium sp. CAG:813]|nr:7TM receptor with intracellular metal dependent phosphohydrolase [Clostridium sp. CAG:813]
MQKNEYFERTKEFLSSSRVLKLLYLVTFTVLITCIIASQNFFFQSIIENGISKRDIIAQKTLTVEDVKRTEQHKREVAQKVEPILVPAEDDFIKSNLETLQNSIIQIRKKKSSEKEKIEELNVLFDLSGNPKKTFILDFLLHVDDASLREAFDKASLSLVNILQKGITEKDYEKDNINALIQDNLITNVSKRQMIVIPALLEQVIVPNLVVDEAATEIAKLNAQEAVKPYKVTFQKGEKIVFEGEPVTRLKRDALREAGYNVYELNWQGILSVYILVLFLTIIYLAYLKFFEKDFLEHRYLALSSMMSIIACSIAVLLPTGFSPYILPIPAIIIISAIFLNPRIAFLLSSLTLVILTVGMQYETQFLIVFTILSIIGMITISKIKYTRRFDLIKAGFHLGVAGVLTMMSLYFIDKCLIDVNNYLILKNCIFLFANSIISSIAALGLSPILESTFHIITPYGLAELGDHNQPLLKRLQIEAPGTYHHSLMVSTLCEAAAEAIGANPILARVGAFYHDIGKLKRPLFFVENQSYFSIENPHNTLNPRLSKMVITAHPKDGVDLAKEYGLPSIINDFILQHHGEGIAKYFYNQAVQEEGAENVKEEQFRYTGPKPNRKETAILMLADAVESAVRAMKGATVDQIENIIDKIIVERLNDGQLADSPLTLKDLKVIASTFSRILRGMQHNRIKYQENIAEEFAKNKIEMPNKILDEDFEKKIKELEDKNHTDLNTDNKKDL